MVHFRNVIKASNLVLLIGLDLNCHGDDPLGHPGEEQEGGRDAVTGVETSRSIDRDAKLTRAVTQRHAVDDADDDDDEDGHADEQEDL